FRKGDQNGRYQAEHSLSAVQQRHHQDPPDHLRLHHLLASLRQLVWRSLVLRRGTTGLLLGSQFRCCHHQHRAVRHQLPQHCLAQAGAHVLCHRVRSLPDRLCPHHLVPDRRQLQPRLAHCHYGADHRRVLPVPVGCEDPPGRSVQLRESPPPFPPAPPPFTLLLSPILSFCLTGERVGRASHESQSIRQNQSIFSIHY
ncbi:hypothetical protein PENTCL1PPCAC_27298, partial [Pristionchus entomophagus]